MKNVVLAFVVLLAVGIALVFATRGVVVTVHNVDVVPLKGVVVHVTGNAYPLGDIQAGADRSVRVIPTGESHVEIEHSEGLLVVDAYFEGGYRGEISVDLTRTEIKRVQDDISIGIF